LSAALFGVCVDTPGEWTGVFAWGEAGSKLRAIKGMINMARAIIAINNAAPFMAAASFKG